MSVGAVGGDMAMLLNVLQQGQQAETDLAQRMVRMQVQDQIDGDRMQIAADIMRAYGVGDTIDVVA